jgi:hypothetical protein|tara:strand:+ start:1931 stop:2212 length:282 start_codon:yes stop_codon:yes gene_type:complete
MTIMERKANSGMMMPIILVGAGFSTAAGALAAISLAHAIGLGDVVLGTSAVGGILGSFAGWRLVAVKRRDPSKPSSVAPAREQLSAAGEESNE